MSYKITKYPDGQINVKINGGTQTNPIIRVSSYEDLFLLKSFSDAHFNYFGYYPSVTIPCLFGQLSDRRFNVDESFDLKNICEFINSCRSLSKKYALCKICYHVYTTHLFSFLIYRNTKRF